MRRAAIGFQIIRHIHEHLIDRIHMNILRRNIPQIDAVDLSADRHISAHLRRCDEIVQFKCRIAGERISKDGSAGKGLLRRKAAAARILLPDDLSDLKKTRSARHADRFQGGRHGKADRFLGTGRVGDHQIGIQRIQPLRNALH